jgi:hypothetical protein
MAVPRPFGVADLNTTSSFLGNSNQGAQIGHNSGQVNNTFNISQPGISTHIGRSHENQC